MYYAPYIPLSTVEVAFTIEAGYGERGFTSGFLISDSYTSSDDIRYLVTEFDSLSGSGTDKYTDKYTYEPSRLFFVTKPSLYLKNLLKLGDIPHCVIMIDTVEISPTHIFSDVPLFYLKGTIYSNTLI